MKNSTYKSCIVGGILIVLLACAAQSSAPTNGLVGHYNFNNSYTDLTGSGLQATPYNTNKVSFLFDNQLNRNVLGVQGDGFTGGMGGYVIIPRPLSLGGTATFSITVLEIAYSHHHGQDLVHVKNGQLGLVGHRNFFDQGDPGLYSMDVKVSSELPAFTYNSLDNSVLITSPQWTSYQIVSDTGLTSLYKNGGLVASVAALLPSEGDITLNYADFGGYSTRLTANYADIRIYDRALSNTEVTDLYNAQVVPEPSTYALLLLSGVASLFALKRRKS